MVSKERDIEEKSEPAPTHQQEDHDQHVDAILRQNKLRGISNIICTAIVHTHHIDNELVS